MPHQHLILKKNYQFYLNKKRKNIIKNNKNTKTNPEPNTNSNLKTQRTQKQTKKKEFKISKW